MDDGTIGRRWARALASALTSDSDLAKVEEELNAIKSLIDQRGDFQQAMVNPGFTNDEREKVLVAVADQFKFHSQTKVFLRLLVQKDRTHYLGDIADAFRSEVDSRLGRVRAHITSAENMNDNEIKDVVNALKKRTGKEVVPEFSVDKSLLAGMQARIGGMVFDNSVKSRLERLKTTLSV